MGHSVSSGSCTRGGHGACGCPASTRGHSGSLGGSPASGLAVSPLAPLPAEGLPAWVQATPPRATHVRNGLLARHSGSPRTAKVPLAVTELA